MIGGTILWFATFIIAVIYVKPTVNDDEFTAQDERDKLALARQLKKRK
jgi:hypothetical protein